MATLADYPDDWEDIFVSDPNFSMVEYIRRVNEYQRLLKAKQDVDDASGMSGGSEGGGALEAGSDVTYGGGPLWDKYGDEQGATNTGPNVVGGNRDMGRAFVSGLSNLTNTGMFGVVNAINNQLNKNKNQTAATPTDNTGMMSTNVIPQLLSTVSQTFPPAANWSLPGSTATTTGANLGITPLATAITAGNGGGLLDATTLEAINAAYDEATNGGSGGWTVG